MFAGHLYGDTSSVLACTAEAAYFVSRLNLNIRRSCALLELSLRFIPHRKIKIVRAACIQILKCAFIISQMLIAVRWFSREDD